MSYDKPTRTYRDTHLAKGWTTKAVYRALKRAVAREIYRALAGRCEVPDYSDLRPARRAKNINGWPPLLRPGWAAGAVGAARGPGSRGRRRRTHGLVTLPRRGSAPRSPAARPR